MITHHNIINAFFPAFTCQNPSMISSSITLNMSLIRYPLYFQIFPTTTERPRRVTRRLWPRRFCAKSPRDRKRSVNQLMSSPHLHWLVVWGFYPSEKYETIGMMTFPIYGKIKNCPNHQQEKIHGMGNSNWKRGWLMTHGFLWLF